MIEIQISRKLDGPAGPFDLNIDINVPSGQFIAIYGESGAGKTSLLRMLAGLMSPDQGFIKVDGNYWWNDASKLNLKPGKRSLGMVFQDFALFPNMTVRDNLNYGLKKDADKGLVDQMIRMVELEKLQDRRPLTLSGGQQQRVALARALVGKPDILLLDEPFSSLDQTMRVKLQDYLVEIHRNFELTTFLVSHDAGEIFKLSDQVLHLEKGGVKQLTSPMDLFSHRHLSGKFQFIGKVLAIEPEDVVFVITVLIDNHLVKIIADQETAGQLSIGDRVLVASKAFNPVIKKI